MLWGLACHQPKRFSVSLTSASISLSKLNSPTLETVKLGNDICAYPRGRSHIQIALGELPMMGTLVLQEETTFSVALPGFATPFSTLSSLFSPLIGKFETLQSIAVCPDTLGSLDQLARTDVWVVAEHSLNPDARKTVLSLSSCREGCKGSHLYSPGKVMMRSCFKYPDEYYSRHFATNIPNIHQLWRDTKAGNHLKCQYSPHRVVFVELWSVSKPCFLCGVE